MISGLLQWWHHDSITVCKWLDTWLSWWLRWNRIYKAILTHRAKYESATLCQQNQCDCLAGHSSFFNILCRYELDENKKLKYCRNGAHLQEHEKYPCSNGYKCHRSYCMSYNHVCDGSIDYPYADDEHKYCDIFTCPYMLKCKGTKACVHPVDVCDGIPHCPNGEDELFCKLSIGFCLHHC